MRRYIEVEGIPIENIQGDEQKVIRVWPKEWPTEFWQNPDGQDGIMCSDIRKEPCEDCDGSKCIVAYIQCNM